MSSGGGALSVVAANTLDGKLAIWSGQPRLPQDRGRSSSFSCHMALPLPFVIQNQRFARDLRTQLIAFPRHRGRGSSTDERVATQEASQAHRPLRVPRRRSGHPDRVDEHHPQADHRSWFNPSPRLPNTASSTTARCPAQRDVSHHSSPR